MIPNLIKNLNATLILLHNIFPGKNFIYSKRAYIPLINYQTEYVYLTFGVLHRDVQSKQFLIEKNVHYYDKTREIKDIMRDYF